MSRFVAVLLKVVTVAAACSKNGEDDTEPLAEDDTATSTEQEVALLGSESQVWTCGSVQQHVLSVVNDLSSTSQTIVATAMNYIAAAEGLPTTIPEPDAPVEEVIAARTVVEAALSGFTAADQTAYNTACGLYGRHAAADELWASNNRDDACDVLEPAKRQADIDTKQIDIEDLHPIVSKAWVGATGLIAEGHGRCVAERAN